MLDLCATGLLPVRLVIQTDAQDLVRVRNDGQEGELRKRRDGCLRLRIRDARERAGDGGSEIGIAGDERGADIDEIIALDEAPGRAAVDGNGCELHAVFSILRLGSGCRCRRALTSRRRSSSSVTPRAVPNT